MSESRFFIGSDGSLYRDENFSHPFREQFRYTFSEIETVSQFKATIRNGEWAWPGGYPMYLVAEDGEAMCFDCAKEQARSVIASMRNSARDGWGVIGTQINWEDQDLYCCHCGKRIESAYCEEE